MRPDTIIFVANSPGEIAGWLLPLVHEARARWPHCRLVLQLMLCEFASGEEERIGRDFLGIEEVLSPIKYWDMLLRRLPHYRNPLIIHLGGDMFYSAMLAKRWNVPLWIYLWGKKWLDSSFSGYFVRDQRDLDNLLRKGISASKVRIVGDLVADATACNLERQTAHIASLQSQDAEQTPSTPLISFLPGSRERELSGLAPFFLEVAQQIGKQVPDCRFQLIASPFIDRKKLQKLLTAPPLPEMGGIRGEFDGEYLSDSDTTKVHIIQEDHLAHLSNSTLAITIPGTKTSELGCLGVPMISILPFNRPDLLPLTGILGLLDFIPFLGMRLKKWLVLHFAKRSRLYALPNILAQKELVPEITGILNSQTVTKRAIALLNDQQSRQEQTQGLRQMYSEYRGAAERIFDILGDDSKWPSI